QPPRLATSRASPEGDPLDASRRPRRGGRGRARLPQPRRGPRPRPPHAPPRPLPRLAAAALPAPGRPVLAGPLAVLVARPRRPRPRVRRRRVRLATGAGRPRRGRHWAERGAGVPRTRQALRVVGNLLCRDPRAVPGAARAA